MGGLVASFPSFSVSCSCLLFFDILSRSIYLIFIVPSISPSYFSLFVLIFLSVDLLFFHVLFVFSPPDFSCFLCLCLSLGLFPCHPLLTLYLLHCFSTFLFLEEFYRFFPQSFRHELRCVCVDNVCAFSSQESVLVFLKCKSRNIFLVFFNRLPWSHLEKWIYRRRGLCEHEQICLGNMWVHPEMVWTKAQFGNVCFKRGKCFACGHMWEGKGQKTRG